MAYEVPGFIETVLASGDLSANQFKVHKLDSNGELTLCGAGQLAYGILQNKPDAQGKAASVMTDGISKAVAGGAFNAGADLVSDGAGALVSPASSGESIVAQAREASAGSGNIVSVKLRVGAGQVN